MASFDITRTELVWPGKYDDAGSPRVRSRNSLPFQTIETINDSRATREGRKQPQQATLFDVWAGDDGDSFENGWRNKLIWGDNIPVMASLLERLAGKVDLIYIDPPFATGLDFRVSAQIGDGDGAIEKAQSSLEEKAYRDTWGEGLSSYVHMMYGALSLMRDLLAENGSIYIHCDYRVNSYVRLVLDELFGRDSFAREIVWTMSAAAGYKGLVANYVRGHETILYYTRGSSPTFNKSFLPYSDAQLARFSAVDEQGRRYKTITKTRRLYLDQTKGIPLTDVWTDIANFQTIVNSPEILGYPTQKPEALLRRVIESSSNPGDLVADFFVGSGTTAAVAEKLGRRWVAADLGRFAIHTTRKRLMEIEGCKPFEVLNLGRYERQYWQSASFGERDAQRVLFEYIAFMLRLYGAEPLPGLQHLHGKRGSVVVHVGAVDAPVTIGEVTDALDECVATGQGELHVLGWEWEMGLNDLVNQLAQERRVRLKLLAIPREVMEAQAVAKGDIRFFELAHLDCNLEVGSKCSLVVELTDFAMSDAEAIDAEVRAKITKWSDFVDYWAIDFDFQNDTFINGWVTYRTRRDRRLALRSDAHRYDKAGTYNVAVKVVDIFGNDTTRVFPVEVHQ